MKSSLYRKLFLAGRSQGIALSKRRLKQYARCVARGVASFITAGFTIEGIQRAVAHPKFDMRSSRYDVMCLMTGNGYVSLKFAYYVSETDGSLEAADELDSNGIRLGFMTCFGERDSDLTKVWKLLLDEKGPKKQGPFSFTKKCYNSYMSKGTVYVGMSGGVDSSLSAALLKEQGFSVVGVFIKVWQPEGIECQWKEDRLDAMRVAAGLGIPFKTLDLEKEYKEGVIDYMLSEYSAGRVPNPDVMCNSEVKFGAFLNWAKKEGADFVATGHYARRELPEFQISNSQFLEKSQQLKTKNYQLLTGIDHAKDQSYFLYRLTQNELKYILFPIGHLEKSEVRKEAEKRGLVTAGKKDSQGLCFVGHVDMQKFLQGYIKTEKGDVLNEHGEVIGVHNGAILFTLGQRHGFTIFKKGTEEAPQYVISKDISNNTITVGSTPFTKEHSDMVTLTKCSWVAHPVKVGDVVDVALRYHGKAKQAEIVEVTGDTARILISGLNEALVSGQSCVLYQEEYCLGGGIIA